MTPLPCQPMEQHGEGICVMNGEAKGAAEAGRILPPEPAAPATPLVPPTAPPAAHPVQSEDKKTHMEQRLEQVTSCIAKLDERLSTEQDICLYDPYAEERKEEEKAVRLISQWSGRASNSIPKPPPVSLKRKRKSNGSDGRRNGRTAGGRNRGGWGRIGREMELERYFTEQRLGRVAPPASTLNEDACIGGELLQPIDPFVLTVAASILAALSSGPKTESQLSYAVKIDLIRCGNVHHIHPKGPAGGLEVRLVIDTLQAIGLVRYTQESVTVGGGPCELHPYPAATDSEGSGASGAVAGANNGTDDGGGTAKALAGGSDKQSRCMCRRIMRLASRDLQVPFRAERPPGGPWLPEDDVDSSDDELVPCAWAGAGLPWPLGTRENSSLQVLARDLLTRISKASFSDPAKAEAAMALLPLEGALASAGALPPPSAGGSLPSGAVIGQPAAAAGYYSPQGAVYPGAASGASVASDALEAAQLQVVAAALGELGWTGEASSSSSADAIRRPRGNTMEWEYGRFLVQALEAEQRAALPHPRPAAATAAAAAAELTKSVGKQQDSALLAPSNGAPQEPPALAEAEAAAGDVVLSEEAKALALEGLFGHVQEIWGEAARQEAFKYIAQVYSELPLDPQCFEAAKNGQSFQGGELSRIYGGAVLEAMLLWADMKSQEWQLQWRREEEESSSGQAQGKYGQGKNASSTGSGGGNGKKGGNAPGRRIVRFRIDGEQDKALLSWVGPAEQLASLDREAAALQLLEERLLKQLMRESGVDVPPGVTRLHCMQALESDEACGYSGAKRSLPLGKRSKALSSAASAFRVGNSKRPASAISGYASDNEGDDQVEDAALTTPSLEQTGGSSADKGFTPGLTASQLVKRAQAQGLVSLRPVSNANGTPRPEALACRSPAIGSKRRTTVTAGGTYEPILSAQAVPPLQRGKRQRAGSIRRSRNIGNGSFFGTSDAFPPPSPAASVASGASGQERRDQLLADLGHRLSSIPQNENGWLGPECLDPIDGENMVMTSRVPWTDVSASFRPIQDVSLQGAYSGSKPSTPMASVADGLGSAGSTGGRNQSHDWSGAAAAAMGGLASPKGEMVSPEIVAPKFILVDETGGKAAPDHPSEGNSSSEEEPTDDEHYLSRHAAGLKVMKEKMEAAAKARSEQGALKLKKKRLTEGPNGTSNTGRYLKGSNKSRRKGPTTPMATTPATNGTPKASAVRVSAPSPSTTPAPGPAPDSAPS